MKSNYNKFGGFDYFPDPINHRQLWGGSARFKGGGGSQVVGHKYYVGIHMLLTQGPVDSFKEVWVGEDFKVWDSSIGEGSIDIDEPDLFGGEKKGGGVAGTIHTQLGTGTQSRNSYLQSALGSDVPAFRYLSGAILEDMYIGTSTYPKPFAFTLQRILTGWDGNTIWYSSKAAIGDDMNPAHIIYELLTSKTFGKGLNSTYMDATTFEAAADTLYTESFGLSYLWGADREPDAFIADILSTINGSLYQNMTNGKFELKLARDDYDVATLEIFDEDEIIELNDFIRPAMGEVPNWVVIKYHDRDLNKQTSVTAHDLAMMDKQGSIVPITHTYSGVCEKTIATELAGRQLLVYSSLLAKMTVKGNRNFAHLRPNDMIKISWSYLGIVELPVRVISVNYGDLESGEVVLKCAEDVYTIGQGLYASPDDTVWQEPWTDPIDSTTRKIIEMPYGLMIDTSFVTQEEADAEADTAGLFGCGVAKPTGDSIDYELQFRADAADNFLTKITQTPFTPIALTATILNQDATQVVLDLSGGVDFTSVEGSSYCMIEDEFLELVSVDQVDVEITVKRGLWDTVPVTHAIGSRIWFFGTQLAQLANILIDGDQPQLRPLTRTYRGSLAEVSATVTTADAFDSRGIRPYAPGNFKVNGFSYPSSFTGQPALTWSHRNRKTQLGTIVTADDAGSYSLESGGYYTLKIYNAESGGGLLHTETPITGTSYTYPELDERSDGGLASADPLHTSLRFVLSCHRTDSSGDIKDSWQEIDFTVSRV